MLRPMQPPNAYSRPPQPAFGLSVWARMGRVAAAAVVLPMLLGAQSHVGSADSRLLDAHNRERAALGLPALRWNSQLAQGAAQWSQKLAAANRMEHSPTAVGGSGHGENLWMGTAGHFAPEAMVGSWIAEKADFTRGTFPKVSRTGSWTDVGHYTQMVWRDTREVGCAIGRGTKADVLVCRYSAPGNIMGRAPF